MLQRGIALLPILLIIGGVVLAGILGFVIWQLPSMTNTQTTNTANIVVNTNAVACTQEAKLCPDGSAVGRTGPNCEFAACPGETNTNISTADWKTYANNEFDFTFQYPNSWIVENWKDIGQFVNGDGRTFSFIWDEIIIREGDVRENTTGSSALSFGFTDISAELFIGRYNSDGDTASQVIAPVYIETVAGRTVKHVTAETAIGLPREYLFFAPYSSGFIISYDDFDSTHKQILSSLTFTEQDPTAWWGTYTNEQYGFTLRYPSMFSVFEESTLLKGEQEYPSIVFAPSNDLGVFSITIYPRKSNETGLAAYLSAVPTDLHASEQTSVSVGGAEGIRIDPVPGLAPAKAVFLAKDNFAFELNTSSRPGLTDEEYNSILSTFQFTN
ncbi:MAG: hypothetical protein WCV86_02390 [Patescibacteria group bacterium]|jgi:hypothetical protein